MFEFQPCPAMDTQFFLFFFGVVCITKQCNDAFRRCIAIIHGLNTKVVSFSDELNYLRKNDEEDVAYRDSIDFSDIMRLVKLDPAAQRFYQKILVLSDFSPVSRFPGLVRARFSHLLQSQFKRVRFLFRSHHPLNWLPVETIETIDIGIGQRRLTDLN